MTPPVPARFADLPAMLLAGLRRHHGFADAGTTIAAQWADFRAAGEPPAAVPGVTYGVICGAGEGSFEYLTGMAVRDFAALPAGMGRMRVPAQRYAVFEHRGYVSGLQAAWQAALEDWLPRSGFRSAERPDFERYDGRFDPATAQGLVEVWIGVVDGRT